MPLHPCSWATSIRFPWSSSHGTSARWSRLPDCLHNPSGEASRWRQLHLGSAPYSRSILPGWPPQLHPCFLQPSVPLFLPFYCCCWRRRKRRKRKSRAGWRWSHRQQLIRTHQRHVRHRVWSVCVCVCVCVVLSSSMVNNNHNFIQFYTFVMW